MQFSLWEIPLVDSPHASQNTIDVSAGMALTSSFHGFAATQPVLALKLGEAEPVKIPANFVGLGYEMSLVATQGLLSDTNDRYVRLVNGLGPEGVLRVGGIVADYTRYEPAGTAVNDPKNTISNRERLDGFNAFLMKVGWTAIWSVNFAQGPLDDAVEEARAVASALGPRLLALEIGNEIENYGRGNKPFRKHPISMRAVAPRERHRHVATEDERSCASCLMASSLSR